MSWVTSNNLNEFLKDKSLLLLVYLFSTRVKFILEERSPRPLTEVN